MTRHHTIVIALLCLCSCTQSGDTDLPRREIPVVPDLFFTQFTPVRDVSNTVAILKLLPTDVIMRQGNISLLLREVQNGDWGICVSTTVIYPRSRDGGIDYSNVTVEYVLADNRGFYDKSHTVIPAAIARRLCDTIRQRAVFSITTSTLNNTVDGGYTALEMNDGKYHAIYRDQSLAASYMMNVSLSLETNANAKRESKYATEQGGGDYTTPPSADRESHR